MAKKDFATILRSLQADYPHFTFIASSRAAWKSREKIIEYSTDKRCGVPSLLHETAHAILGHSNFSNDSDLILKELEAWRKAKELANAYDITIDQEYVENCLDTYRTWLYQRGKCPQCKTNGSQATQTTYTCQNCLQTWQVTDSRLSRVYRICGLYNTKK
jgi:hypothetical protein